MKPFIISPSSGIPIYRQLFSQIELMVLNDRLKEGEARPSVRSVAMDLEINPMTVSKAYGLLEERGYLTRLRGKAMVVAKQENSVSTQEKETLLNEMITQLINDAACMGIEPQQVLTTLKQHINTQTHKKDT
ncbi:MAG: GntR family transcriptional regulator [Psychrobium sp.]|nr:GntR family transcriptional regulator [Psychrobium sp.]